MSFQVGDKVIYPNHGLGVVEKIEEKTILGTTCGFFHLRILSNETTVLVPVVNVDNVGLRRAITDEEVERLFHLLGDGKIDNHQNWKGRFKDNSDKMRTGSIYDMADVLKSLTFLSKSKSLSFREKRMLDRAKSLIISEVSEVMRSDRRRHRRSRREGARALLHDEGARRAARGDPRRDRQGHAGQGARRTRAAVGSPSGARRPRRRVQTHGSQTARDRAVASIRRPTLFLFPLTASACHVRSVVLTYVLTSLYVLIVGTSALLIAVPLRWKGLLYELGHAGVALALGTGGHPLPRHRPRAHPAGSRGGVLRQPPEQRRSAGAVPGAAPRGCTSSTRPSCARFPVLGRVFEVGGFVAGAAREPRRGVSRRSSAPPRRFAPATRS